MPSHWTYCGIPEDAPLQQGDILDLTKEVQAILSEEHSGFIDSDYYALMVLTQSCDLVVRKNACRAKHLMVAGIQFARPYLQEVADSLTTPAAGSAYPEEKKDAFVMTLQKICNQNESNEGIFYLHPDSDSGIGEPSISKLRHSISVKLSTRYDLFQKARIGRLDVEFEHKLGWMVSNLFGRIGTRDWHESQATEQALNGQVKQWVDDFLWISKAQIDIAAEKNLDLDSYTDQQLREFLKRSKPGSARAIVAKAVVALAEEQGLIDSDRKRRKLETALMNDTRMVSALRKSKFDPSIG